MRPDLCRHVTLALPRQGKQTPACRVVAETVQQLVQAWGQQLTEPTPPTAPNPPGRPVSARKSPRR